MKNKKSAASSMILGVAFVWFTTHFGGGFASGAQIYSYYVRYGIWCLLMPVLAMGYNALFFAYCLRFARKHEVYDYRSYNNAFYGKFAPVFSNLFEILYICVMCVAPAVAFATGGATLSTLTGLPYLLYLNFFQGHRKPYLAIQLIYFLKFFFLSIYKKCQKQQSHQGMKDWNILTHLV